MRIRGFSQTNVTINIENGGCFSRKKKKLITPSRPHTSDAHSIVVDKNYFKRFSLEANRFNSKFVQFQTVVNAARVSFRPIYFLPRNFNKTALYARETSLRRRKQRIGRQKTSCSTTDGSPEVDAKRCGPEQSRCVTNCEALGKFVFGAPIFFSLLYN